MRLRFFALFLLGIGLMAAGSTVRGRGQAREGKPDLGAGARLRGKPVFPDDNPWNTDISKQPVDPHSDTLIASIGLDKSLHPDFGGRYHGMPSGIPYIVVAGNQPGVAVHFKWPDESDPGPYPIPPDAPIEGGPDATGDRHVLVVDRDHWKLYELFRAFPEGAGWRAGTGAVFNLNSDQLRPEGWTSADAAGLPIFAGLARYEEAVERRSIPHALRFTCRLTRRAYVTPARHFASRSNDPDLPPMGMRVRLKASVNIAGFPPTAQVILKALKKYGMILADNGGDWFVSGAADPRWNEQELETLKRVKGADFEVVQMDKIVTR